MSWHKTRQLAQSDYLKLAPILVLAFYIAFIPHLNYPYPLHVDEWVHIARTNALMHPGSVNYPGSFLLEAGFHIFLGTFQNISGISWMTIFRYSPSIIFVITVLTVYIMARREGFGLEAAFFTCLIPTTVGILGPAFLIPMSIGLLFTPLILFLAFNYQNIWSYLIIFLFICFLLAIHAPSAICPIIVLTPYILLNLKGNFKHSLGIGLAFILPFLGVFPWIFGLLLPTAKGLLVQQPPTDFVQLPRLIKTYGYLPTLFCFLGTFLLVIRGSKKNYGLVLGLLALLLMLVTFFTFHYGVPIMYERGLMFMMLMLSIVAGAGLMELKNFQLPEKVSSWIKVPFITRNVGRVLCLVLVGIILAISIPARLDTPYYHMIDKEDYQAFVWVKENVAENYEKAILDPWKATAFTALTGKNIYTRIHEYPKATDEAAYGFLRDGSVNTAFLRENGISIIYTRVYDRGQNKNIGYGSDNPELEEIAPNIYLLREVEKPE
ncbi:hypothetical protein ES707_12973 [subsurface metagenome]